MHIVTKVTLLMHATGIGAGGSVFPLAGWFLNPDRQQFYAAWFLLFLVLAIMSFILRNYIIRNASATERKTLREAGQIK